MYAKAVYWDVASQVTLQDTVACAAFQLAQACSGDDDGVDQDVEVDEEDYDSDSEQVVFDWEETRSPLPTDLAHLWKRYEGKDHETYNVKEFFGVHQKV